MGKFSGYMIVTDLDGTLLKNDKRVSEENLRAIRYFKDEGGLFSFVTGRIPEGVGRVLQQVQPNAPCGHGNGTSIYDHCTKTRLWERSVDVERAVVLVDYALQQEPSIGVIACTHDTAYFQKKNAASEMFRCHEGFEDKAGNVRTITEPLSKIMFTDSDEPTLLRLMERVSAHPLANEFMLIRTDTAYYELLPKNASKGDLILRLSQITGVPIKQIIAVGDNDNDASMLKAAGVGIAVSNASEAAKAAADRITVSHEEHAIACMIKELEVLL